MQDCIDNEWGKSDAELNRVYQESLKKLKPEQAALLKKAQHAWLTYRDAQCEPSARHPDSRAHENPEGHLPKLKALAVPTCFFREYVAAAF